MFRHPDMGLLIIRIAIGLFLAYMGYTKFSGGEKALNAVGENIRYLGLDVGTNNISTMFFGVLGAGSELVGGLFLTVGILFRTSAAFLFITMVVATLSTLDSSQGDIGKFGFPLILALTILGLLFTGAGRISVQRD